MFDMCVQRWRTDNLIYYIIHKYSYIKFRSLRPCRQAGWARLSLLIFVCMLNETFNVKFNIHTNIQQHAKVSIVLLVIYKPKAQRSDLNLINLSTIFSILFQVLKYCRCNYENWENIGEESFQPYFCAWRKVYHFFQLCEQGAENHD